MKMTPDCFPCFLNQALRVARLQGCSKEQEYEVLQTVAILLPELDLEQTPPANAVKVYTAIADITGCVDPYLTLKKKENELALLHLPHLRNEVSCAESPLATAISFSIAGNIIDYGAAAKFDVDDAFRRSREVRFSVDHREALLKTVKGLSARAKVLYLADNCGEIVYDSLVIEILAQKNLEIIVAVKSGAIINDALIADAYDVGLDKWARILTNGTSCPGTPLDSCSEEFLDEFKHADLVISKGQGNFETLSDAPRDIFFLLTLKCKVVAEHVTSLAQCESSLEGKGEMVVYHLER